jgi:hypothetical protein
MVEAFAIFEPKGELGSAVTNFSIEENVGLWWLC